MESCGGTILYKQNMKRRSQLTAAVLCGALMLGCSSGCGTKKTASDETVVSVAGFFSDESVMPEVYERQRKQADEFEKLHPGVKIEQSDFSFDSQSFLAKAEGGTLPTLYYVPLTEANAVLDMGYGADITDEFKKRGMIDNANTFILENISRNGKVYLIPSSMYDVGLIVNTDLYQKAGFIDADGTLYQPTDWEDLARVAQKIKETTGADGFILPTMNNTGGWRFMPIAWSYGTTFEEKDGDQWKATFDSQECVNAMQYISDLKWKYDVLPKNTQVDLAEVEKQFAAGNVGMIMGEASVIGRILATYDFDKNKIGMLSLPAGPKRHVTLMGGDYRVISKDATKEQITAAMDFLEYIGITAKLTEEMKVSMRETYEQNQLKNNLIGLKSLSPWKDDCEVNAYKLSLDQEFLNVDPKHLELYNHKDGIEFQAEEPIDAQALYAILDSVIQEVMNNQNADISGLLKKACEDFQKNNLDYAE